MRRYEEDFNEEYEKGFRDGRRDALRELNESSLQGLDKYKTNKVKIGWGINRYEIKVEEGYEFPAESAWLFERDFKSNHVYTDKEDGLKFKVDEIKKGQSYYFVNSEYKQPFYIYKATVKDIEHDSYKSSWGGNRTDIYLDTGGATVHLCDNSYSSSYHNDYQGPARYGQFLSQNQIQSRINFLLEKGLI